MAVKPSTKVLAKKPAAKAVQAQPSPTRPSVSDGKTERSVEIRKIENGYIVRESSYGGKGGCYKSTERFCEKAPMIDVPKMAKGKK